VIKSIPHYFRASTLRLIARDLYYRLPLPAPVKWAIRNAIVRLLRRRGWRIGVGVHGPWLAALAASRRVPQESAEVRAAMQPGSDLSARAFPAPAAPQASVIIPVYNKLEYTVACLLSILANRPRVTFEVIVVDDASSDGTEALLGRWPGLRYARNAGNLGFIGSCNRGAELASGKHLCFLNNDTNVLRGWLDELCWTMENVERAGVAGSKLVYPNGELQESGGIVWRDASAWNYGHLGDPDEPRVSYLRDVDYVSGASLMVPAALFRELGGFDLHYKPAYYEDSDLAFKVRQRGQRVLVQPASMVIHFEGVSAGRDLNTGMKRYQVVNHGKFRERWKQTLATHRENGVEPEREKERPVAKRLLMIDGTTPRPDRDAGSVTAEQFMLIFQRLGYKVTFAPENLRFDGDYTLSLQRRGIECIYYPQEPELRRFLRRRGGEFDAVFVARPYVAGPLIRHLRRHCPRARLVYNSVDLHYLREERQAALEGNPVIASRAARTKRVELGIFRAVDRGIVISPQEKAVLAREIPEARVEVVPLVLNEEPPGLPFVERRGLVFIGGSVHPPNADAVEHLVRDIVPALRAAGIDDPVHVIGERSAAERASVAGPGVEILGHVADIAPYFHRARCMLVPLRYGAGLKGKIGTAFAYGLPVISSPVGAEGMELVEGRDYLVAAEPAAWAAQVARLKADAALWSLLAQGGRQVVRERYSPQRIALTLKTLLEDA
jgi:GT2 family glycosyltransferase/glycosyltransferase involved in cell wall biosynthesis